MNDTITVQFGAEVTALHGTDTLEAVMLQSATGETHLPAAALFVMLGAAPDTGWLSGLADLDTKGFVPTLDGFATWCPGIIAVGDVRARSVKRMASAVGEGSVVISKVLEQLATSSG